MAAVVACASVAHKTLLITPEQQQLYMKSYGVAAMVCDSCIRISAALPISASSSPVATSKKKLRG